MSLPNAPPRDESQQDGSGAVALEATADEAVAASGERTVPEPTSARKAESPVDNGEGGESGRSGVDDWTQQRVYIYKGTRKSRPFTSRGVIYSWAGAITMGGSNSGKNRMQRPGSGPSDGKDGQPGHSAFGRDGSRAVSELTGIILLFGIVAAGIAIVAATGFVALDAVQGQTDEQRAIQKMDVVRGGVENVQYGQQEYFEDVQADASHGNMTVVVNGDEENRTELEMGAFIHESDAGVYTSQAGGTWTETDDGSRMIHEPALTHQRTVNDGTDVWSISIPPLEIEETPAATTGDGVTAGYQTYDDGKSIADQINLSEKETLRQIRLEIESDYSEAWARYFEQEFPTHRHDSAVERDGDEVVATAPLGEGLPNPADPGQFDLHRTDPSKAVSTPEDLNLSHVETDSYDSVAGPYDDPDHDRYHGYLETNGTADLHQTHVNGTVFATDGVECHSSSSIDTGADWDDDVDDCEVDQDDWEYEPPASVSDNVSATIDAIDYLSEETDDVEGVDEFDERVESGVYHLEEGTINESVTLDVTDGDVVIAVDGDLAIEEDVEVATDGSKLHDVRWFVDGNVTIENQEAVGDTTNDRAPQHWLFQSDAEDRQTSLDPQSSFTGVIYSPGNEVYLNNTDVYGAVLGEDVYVGQQTHFAYDRALDPDPRIINGAGIGGPNVPYDSEVTLAGADFAWSPRHSATADTFDVFDVFDPGTYDSFDVNMPLAGFDHREDPDEMEYFEAALGTTSETETTERTISGETESEWWEVLSDPSDEEEIDVETGDTLELTADDESTELRLAETDQLIDDEVARDNGTLEYTAKETQTLTLGIVTEDERSYEVDLEKSRHYDEISFEATEYDEFRVSVNSTDSDFFLELREDGEVMEGGLFDGDATWTSEAGETISEEYAAYESSSSFDGGEATIRIGSLEDQPIEYDMTLEQSEVNSGFLESDPPWFQQFPIETELQFQNETATAAERPWPDTALENNSDPTAAHLDDVNHPAVEYPKTHDVEGLEPGERFAPQIDWRDGFCSEMDSYGGTWRTDDEDELLFEKGCSEDGDTELTEDLDVFDHFDGNASENYDRIKILQDGDVIPDLEEQPAQENVEEMLERTREDGDDVVDESGDKTRLDLEDGEFVMLFELAPDDFHELEYEDESLWYNAIHADEDNDRAPDFNDKVMTFEITDVDDDFLRYEGVTPGYHETLETPDGVITADG